jgi:hypothetical protein
MINNTNFDTLKPTFTDPEKGLSKWLIIVCCWLPDNIAGYWVLGTLTYKWHPLTTIATLFFMIVGLSYKKVENEW